jgi:hypothetical protein
MKWRRVDLRGIGPVVGPLPRLAHVRTLAEISTRHTPTVLLEYGTGSGSIATPHARAFPKDSQVLIPLGCMSAAGGVRRL